MVSFLIIRENGRKERFYLDGSSITIGRDASCEICLPETEISRQHVRIWSVSSENSQEYQLMDLGSLNGTFVNGSQVTECLLHRGDTIQVGSTFLIFSAEAHESGTERSVFSVKYRSPSAAAFSRTSDVEEDSSSENSLDVTMATSEDQARILRTISHTEGERFLARKKPSLVPEVSWPLRAQGFLQLLYEMTLSISHCMDIDRLSQELLELIFQWIDADRGCILLFDQPTNRLVPKAKKVREHVGQQRMIISKTILDYVLEHREGVLTSDATQDDRWNEAASVLSVGIHEAICVPLQGRYGIVGAIYLDTFSRPEFLINPEKTHRLGDEHLKLMITIAHHTAIAIEDTRYYSGMLQAERLAAIGQTVATLSHHIKNILQGIQGGSYLIETGLKQHNETFISKGWQVVERNQNRISSLVMDMLTFSKDRKPEIVKDNLNRVVSDVVELMQSRAASRNVLLTWLPDTAVPETEFDPEAIHHAVLNLVTNAIDAAAESLEYAPCEMVEGGKTIRFMEEVYSPEAATKEETESVFADGSHIFHEKEEEPAVEVDASESGIHTPCGQVDVVTLWDEVRSVVKIIVKDTGPGLTKEQIGSIFKPFESTKGNRGTGLGLPVCKKIIREHGGTIHVEQRAPRGSRFVVTLS